MAAAKEAMRAEGSSEKDIESFTAATAGMTQKQRQAYTLKKRADEARIQQLRGIFAAYDEDRDGMLSRTELESACLALGLDPSQRVLDRFLHVSPVAGSVDLATFVRVCMTRAGGDGTASSFQSADSSESLLLGLFAQLDTSGTGRVPLATLLHVLAEVDTPSALSVEEVQELLRMTGILNERTLKDPRTLYAMEVDYSALVKHLTFALPVSVGAGGGGAAASAKAATGRGASASASSAASATPSSLR